ncbi:hypothetical protein [Nesterenkonia rhizosphaerae]|uniref:Flp pilus-assembly TadG-like N-terminal domain-containing protein n=1 Tax=Nesterenkonia rhizosphaerae TaxID=1348272 RepID=A0ABP9G007_9MICC
MHSLQRLRRDESGNYVVQNLFGAVAAVMVITTLVVAVTMIFAFQRSITMTTALADQITRTDTTLRSDIAWAGNIPHSTASPHGVRIIQPGWGDDQCREVTWQISAEDDRRQLVRTAAVYETYEFAPEREGNPITAGSETGASICAGTLVTESTEVMINDTGSAQFTYYNGYGVPLSEHHTPEGLPEDRQSPATMQDRALAASSQIAGVQLDTHIASTTDRARELTVLGTAQNLERKPLEDPREGYRTVFVDNLDVTVGD